MMSALSKALLAPLLALNLQIAEPLESFPWHPLQPSELEYAARAPHLLDNQMRIEAPPAEVFRVLSESDWRDWFVDFKSVNWTSPAPYQVGSTRTVSLALISVKERFLAWEPGRRFSFSIDAISLPVLDAMMEDIQLEPLDNGRATQVRWRVSYAPGALMTATLPLAQAIFGGMFRQSLENLKTYTEMPRIQRRKIT